MKTNYALCLNNQDYEVDLQIGKLYRLVEPQPKDSDCMIRLVDDSGEDYLFERSRFHIISLPESVIQQLESATAA